MVERKQIKDTSTQEVEKKGRLKESPTFEGIFTRYADSVTALREFFSRLNPFVAKMKKGIKRERQAYIKEFIRDFGQRASEDEVEELGNFLVSLKDKVTKKGRKVRTPRAAEITSPLVQEFALKLLRVIFRDVPSDFHRELLNKSILMSLVSYFEVLVADLAHAFYRIAPDAISTDDKVLSVNELKQFSSIDEALRSIISDRIDKLLRESVNDWREFFQSRMGIGMKLLVPEWAQWNEYFQRRPIMVHAGGRVTERYLSNVDWERVEPFMSKPSLGDTLTIDDVYIENAIDVFEIAGLLLCQEVWRKLVPKDSEATEDSMLICKFNRWLCIKRQGRWTDVEEEVKAFDYSAKHRKFALARASLLERADEFFELLPAAVGTDISIGGLKEWPILDEMRTDQRFGKIIAEAEQ